jgi:hypothetical protein
MRRLNWQKWVLSLASSGMLFQITGCTETAINLTALATTVTAGGVIYLIVRIID